MPAKVALREEEAASMTPRTDAKTRHPRLDDHDEEQPRRPSRRDAPLSSKAVDDNVPPEKKKFTFRILKKSPPSSPESEMDDEGAVEEDPVMSLFKARSTQRVRFQLENAGPTVQEARDRPEKSPISSPQQSASSLKKFMKSALFTKGDKYMEGSAAAELDDEVSRELESAKRDMVWESFENPSGSEVVHTRTASGRSLDVSFSENKQTRAQVIKLLNKARRAQFVHYRYEYAVKCYIKSLDLLTKAQYPDDHPTVAKTLGSLNNAYHALSSYKNSANIVKMGIKYEDTGELVRALKMYTIAYRIRRDNLSRTHPSLVVLLNMLGSIQVKRGELEEAMQIYELALKDSPVIYDEEDNLQDDVRPMTCNLLARSVTYREMGVVYEKWGETDEALNMYHKSLDCVAEFKGLEYTNPVPPELVVECGNNDLLKQLQVLLDLPNKVETTHTMESWKDKNDVDEDAGGMELYLGSTPMKGSKQQQALKMTSSYDVFFPPELDEYHTRKQKSSSKKNVQESKGDHTDVDVALTLHHIAQLHRAQGEYNMALAAFHVSLRGMRHSMGRNHPNVAAILGNIGNLQKEMGDMDAAFETYQQVLGIESYRLGLSHPDVAITLHNIATIDAARGNHEHALALYRQVVNLQRKLFGEDNVTVSVTLACMGDVYERLNDLKNATECFEESVRIKTSAYGRHSLEVARLLHKLGKISLTRGDYHLADSYISRCILIYRLNKLSDQDEWVVEAYRDAADIDAAIAMGRGNTFEC
jgi:tetratricopeptide (TPR) repeat protein